MFVRESQKKAQSYEKTQASKHRGKHIGGPGEPDYTRGSVKGEVKRWKRPVDSGVIKKLAGKGVKEVVSKSGFTGPAKEEAKRRRIKLIGG